MLFRSIMVRFTAVFNTGTSNNNQWIGLFDNEDGFAIGYNGTNLSILHRQNSVDTIINSSSWDDPLDGSGISEHTLDPQKGSVYEIKIPWLGYGDIRFNVMVKGEWIEFHKLLYGNLNTTPLVYQPSLPLRAESENISNITDVILKTPSIDRKSTRLNSSHVRTSRMPSSA